MDLYLIRHGIAADRGTYENDDDRPLTEAGRAKTRQVAQRLRDLGLQFDAIFTSPLVRAQQTADLLQAAQLSQSLQELALLAPEGSFTEWLHWLDNQRSTYPTLALVGHEPDLSTWAECLVWGQSHHCITLKKAGAIGLQLPDSGSPVGRSQLFWLTPPRLLL